MKKLMLILAGLGLVVVGMEARVGCNSCHEKRPCHQSCRPTCKTTYINHKCPNLCCARTVEVMEPAQYEYEKVVETKCYAKCPETCFVKNRVEAGEPEVTQATEAAPRQGKMMKSAGSYADLE